MALHKCMRIASTLTLLCWITGNAAFAERSEQHDQTPNIVMIISDDQAWGDYSFMGHPHIKTPHLDRLASQSRTFTRGYVPSSLCRPSLVTMITGLYPHQHLVSGNDPKPPAGQRSRQMKNNPQYNQARERLISHIDKQQTLPKLLMQKSYLSFQCGKWWEGNYSRGGFTHGMTRGFPNPGGRHGDEGLKIGREGMQPLYDFINHSQKQNKPFFVWYAPFLPHTPHNPPERLLNQYKNKTESLFVAKYWAMCEWFDETCGQLLDYLDKQQLSENTIVVYVTDNGWIQSPDNRKYAPRSKRSPNEGGIRTPIMVRWPGHTEPKRDDTTLVSSIDLLPTLLAACNLQAKASLPGINLLDDQKLKSRKQIFGEIFDHDVADSNNPAASLQYRWCISDNWKLILPNNAYLADTHPVELYDLKTDPHEKQNVAEQHPRVVQQLTTAIDSWWNIRQKAQAH